MVKSLKSIIAANELTIQPINELTKAWCLTMVLKNKEGRR